MSLLNVSEISRKERGEYVLKNINFIQEPSQKIAIAGSTGSGKTTLLKIIAGLVQPNEGVVLFEGQKVPGPMEKLLPGHTQIAYLSQNFELRNNYKVEELLQMANKFSDVDAMLIFEICRINHLLKRRSDELSGGEKQRVAFAQALSTSPKLLLLDEPFSNLDAIHRSVLKNVIADTEQRLSTSCILVSHDPVDLLSWADEIIILNNGKIIQRASAEEVYLNPVNEYVAALFGTYNLISPELTELFPALEKTKRRFLRPVNFRIVVAGDGTEATVTSCNYFGNYYEIEVINGSNKLIIYGQAAAQKGSKVYITLNEFQQVHHLE